MSTYIKFTMPTRTTLKRDRGIATQVFEMLARILTLIIPKANSDFDGKIDRVKQWILEFEEDDGIPTSEIGLNKSGEIIMIMP